MNKSFSGATDLLGDCIPDKRTNDRPEAAALIEVLKALKAHPAVVWCERMNTGAARVGNRFIRFGFTGCPDVLGQLNDGLAWMVDQKTFPAVLSDSGLRLFSSAWQNKPGMRKILTEKNLAGYRKVNSVSMSRGDVIRELEITYSIGGA
jgi:hypothetical protein